MADTSWKDKRRKNWAHKIAELEAETEQIQSRTQQSWQALQSRSLSLGAAQQRRQYSVVVRRHPLEEVEYEPEWFEATSKQTIDSVVDSQDEGETCHASFSQETLERSERVRRLLAVKLALNLTIYLNTGVSASKVRREIRIPDWDADFEYASFQYQDLQTLLRRMKHLCSVLGNLKEAFPDGAIPVKHEIVNADSHLLENAICEIAARYETNSIGMPEFISSYTLAVLRSPVSPTSKAYLALFRAFARGSSGFDAPSHDLAMQTLFAWEQSRLPIHDYDIWAILTELARRKHVQKFDGLMRDLTITPSPINVIAKWTWERAGDIQVPVPKSYNPAILVTLIHCALRFDQPHKAEAWSEILRRTWMDVNDPTQKTPLQQVFTNWMRYYEVQGNWRKGVAWLDAAQKWAITVASFEMYSLQRLAVGMLSLCFACGKTSEYEDILNATVDSGIPAMNPEHYLERTARRAICREWVLLHDQAYRNRNDSRTDQEKVQAFQRKVKLVVQKLLPEKDSADLEWRQEQDDKPNALMRDPRLKGPDETAAKAMESWVKLYTGNQEANQNSMALAEKWRVQCVKQQKEIDFLKSKLQFQKDITRSFQARVMQTQAKAEVQTPSHNQIENQREPEIMNDFQISGHVKVEEVDNQKTESSIVNAPLQSRLFESERVEGAEKKSNVTDNLLLSHLIQRNEITTPGQESDTIRGNSVQSCLVKPENIEMRKVEVDHSEHESDSTDNIFLLSQVVHSDLV